jgi:hypothetical protein
MRLRLERVPRKPNWPLWAVAIVLVWLAAVELTVLFAPDTTMCNFKRWTGVPCPTCGMTRGITSVARGDLAAGFAYNPLFLTVMLGFLLLLAARIAFKRALRLDVNTRERKTLWWAALFLIATNWTYLIFAGT